MDEAPAPAVDAPAESPAETVADDWETAADAGAAPAPLEEEAAAPAPGDGDGTSTGASEPAAPAEEAAAPAPAATDAPRAPPEPNAWKTPVEAETTVEAPAAAAEAPAPAEEDAWETVGRRPRRAGDAAPAAPVRRRGTVINVNRAEGYCFVKPDAGGTNVFLSFKERYAESGDRIEYELVPSGRPERHAVRAGRAVNLSRGTRPADRAARPTGGAPRARRTTRGAARVPPVRRAAAGRRRRTRRPCPRAASRASSLVRGGAATSCAVRTAPKTSCCMRMTWTRAGASPCTNLYAIDATSAGLTVLFAHRPTRVDRAALSAPPAAHAILAVGDRVCYALAPARYPDRLAYYRLRAPTRARAARLAGRAAVSTAGAGRPPTRAFSPTSRSTRPSRGCSPR